MANGKDIKYEAALFDLDGVLIDSEGAYSMFWDDVARRTGKPESFALDIKGTTLTNILNTHFPPELHGTLVEAIHNYEEEMPYAFFEGAEEFLLELKAMGIPMAIVTSSDDNKMRALFRRIPSLEKMMDAIVDGSMVSRSKPHPEGYLKAASMLGVEPEKCIVFEDSIQGLEAGRRAGGKVVGLITTNPAADVEPLSDVAIHSFKETDPQTLGFRK